jgi:hypothetical protein
VNKVKGYLIIPVWLLLSIATTTFLAATFTMNRIKKSKQGQPYFKTRSIASVNE